MVKRQSLDHSSEDIAIVGMAVNVPGAQSVDAYWANLRAGVESIRRLDDATLLANGESAEKMRGKNYVPAAAVLDGFETFDAEFFGFSPKDAAILDPQHRKFLEVAWEAMEQAGHPPETLNGQIGLYAGCGMGSYFYFNICSNPDLVDDVGMFLLRHTGNDKDFLSTRVSHVFDLKGPSINLQTACSTSLVAIHYAAQALRAGEVDMALAGGVTIELPQGRGYEFKENEILSPDGHCHAFDHRAEGTVFGSGAGCVALRRLSDAIADGDHIWGVIKGSAVNNDGAAKAGYLAPSVDGQASAIRAALDTAGVAAQSIGYIECHGTGTYLGDPIEVAALTEAHRSSTDARDYCRIGSVKTNIGHLDTAAGVAGLVKATLALHHREIPPSLGFERPNPAIAFAGSPFSVADKLLPWPSDTPRRAAVNALGVGGTNAHAILEEAPARATSEESDWPFQALVLSARSNAALDAASTNLAAHLRAHPEQPLADVAWTLKQGRRAFDKRRVVVAETHAEAAQVLEEADARKVFTHEALADAPDVVFMFPGGGAQYPDMARDLYETEPVFADWMDRGLDHLQAQLDYDIRALWLPQNDPAQAAEKLKKPSAQLPLIAITEYALAQLWLSWGVKPAAMVGHSMGENVAACLAGVMSFENLIDLVLLRGRLFDTVPAGGMLSISLPLEEVTPLLGDALDIASVNAPTLTAVSGPQAALDTLQETLTARDVDFQRIAIDIAAHSRMLDPILAKFRAFLTTLDLQAPNQPFLSNRTGEMITAAQATDPDYWVAQLRNTVHFADCIATLSATGAHVYLEVGPGKALSSLAGMCDGVKPAQVLATLRHPDHDIGDDAYFMTQFARLWACGVTADWSQIWGGARRNRVILPTYPFQRASYFIEPGKAAVEVQSPPERHADMADWGWVPRWKPKYADSDPDGDPQRWLIFADDGGKADAAGARLADAGHTVTYVVAGDAFAQLGSDRFSIAAEQGRDSYDALLAALSENGGLPDRIAHFWLVTEGENFRPGSSFFDRNLEQGFWSLVWLGQALAEAAPDLLHIDVFTNGAAQTVDEALAYPEKAMIAGPLGALCREVTDITCATVDLEMAAETPATRGWFAKPASDVKIDDLDAILEELTATPANTIAAHRGGRRLELTYAKRALPEVAQPAFKQGGTYLITGGFGGIGQTIAADLLTHHSAHVVLQSRGKMPERDVWPDYLASHGASDPVARRIRAATRLAALGGTLDVVSGDVANPEDMRAVLDGIENLTGVIHAAGALDDAPLLGKSDADAQAVLTPKVQGLRVLDALLPDGSIDLMVLFASTSTATRGAGQADYVAANEYLNAYAASKTGGKTRVVAVNWGVWADVGMAAQAVGNGATGVMPMRAMRAALLARSGADAQGDPVFEAPLNSADWLLDQHRTADGRAVMPGTGTIELLAEAARAQGLRDGFTISDLYFLRALDVADGADRMAKITFQPDGAGYRAELHSDVQLGGRTGWQMHAQAQISPAKTPSLTQLDLDELAARFGDAKQAQEGGRLTSPQEAHLKFGPEWHVLRSQAWQDGEGLAFLSLDENAGEGAGTILHPGLLDLATGWAIGHVPEYSNDALWVPVSYGQITVHAPLPRMIASHVRLTQHSDGAARFDVTIAAPDGAVLVELRDFTMTRLAGGFATTPPDSREVVFDEGNAPRDLTPAQERLAYAVSQGITAAEGPEALARALATGSRRIYVTPTPLDALIAQAALPPAAPKTGQSYARPDTGAELVAPRTATEMKLAETWSTLLGIDPIGVEDSFFDLGGHSLNAVRLFAAVKREWGVDFPISVLFEAPTIAKCAALIVAQTGADPDAVTDAQGGDAPQRFNHLVPLNQNTDANAAPLFVVAGMFGNVLNLRHLAMQFGDARRVFGLQARGLIGDNAPHETVEAAAADYIAEIRQVQAEGPYLLSGFSGGGIMAYEMAQQLRTAGQEVAVLALLDTPLPVRPSLSKPDKALIKLAELRGKGPRFLLDWARARWGWERRGKHAQDGGGDTSAAFNNRKIEQAFLRAVAAYETPGWDGPVALFRPKLDLHWKVTNGAWVSAEREYVFADNDWTRYAPLVEVIEVPGNHDSMVLSPNVLVMAAHLRRIIDAALADTDARQATAAE